MSRSDGDPPPEETVDGPSPRHFAGLMAGQVGRHVLIDGLVLESNRLNDLDLVRDAVLRASAAGGGQILDIVERKFAPEGLTVIAMLAESHIAVHTWPVRNYFAADLFFCGRGDPMLAGRELATGLGATQVVERQYERSAALPIIQDISAQVAAAGQELWTEVDEPFGVFQQLAVHRLWSEHTPHQHLEILENESLGRILCLDGIVQTTQLDEFVYHEMMVHVPMLGGVGRFQDSDVRVLIVGGGDGGTLRQVLQHRWVSEVTMIELDQRVIELSNEFLRINGDYDDERVNLLIGDAAEVLGSDDLAHSRFDLVIVDATDPTGPGEVLYASRFLEGVASHLKPSGFAVRHAGVPHYQLDVLADAVTRSRDVADHVEVYRAPVPTYLGGDLAFCRLLA